MKAWVGERSVWRVCSAILAVAVLGVSPPGTSLAADDHVPRVHNSETPRDGVVKVELRELWRVGGADDEIIFGSIGQVLMDDDRNVYVLDRQLSEVHVYSGDGEYLRTLSREGDGPGELRYPRDMVILPDGNLGVVQMMPGKIVELTLDGIPAGSITPGGDPSEGGVGALFSAWSRNGRLLVCGDTMRPAEGVFARTRYLARVADDGTEQARYLENTMERDLANFKWDEEGDYFVHFGGCALGDDGRVYLAPERNRYEIHVFNPEGDLERVIERPFKQPKRSQQEKDVVNDTRRMIINGREIEKEISDYDPCIARLWVDEANYLWVAHSRSHRDQPEGVFESYDVFDPDGNYVYKAEVAVSGDSSDDRLFFLGGDRAVVVKGFVGGAIAMVGARGDSDSGEELEDEAGLEVIAYRVTTWPTLVSK